MPTTLNRNNKFLILYKANFLSDLNHRTALHFATANDQPNIVKKLLSHPDIDVNVRSKKGLTPVMEATKNSKLKSLEVMLIMP